MKLATYVSGGQASIGRVEADGIVPLPSSLGTMIDVILRWPRLAESIRQTRGRPVPFDKLTYLPPIPRPGKILAIGLNYADHIRETGAEMPRRQVWFCKQPTAANGPYAPIILPKGSAQTDYEAEMVVVIGKGGRNIPREAAPGAVFGYCCGNDISARDWQMATSQWMLGKSFDSHAPFGPWITTADDIADPHALGVRSYVNGEKRQDSNTRELVFSVWEQIALVSQVMTLEPGDLIFTGTPGGVGMAMNPPRWLSPGDRVRVEVDSLGALEAECRKEE